MPFRDWKRKKAYNSWYGMLNRAAGLGKGRGRYVDNEWQASFEVFVSEVGLPSKKSQVLCLHDPEAGFYPMSIGARGSTCSSTSRTPISYSTAMDSRRSQLLPEKLGFITSMRERLERAADVSRTGERIRAIRVAWNLSQEKLAYLASIRLVDLRHVEQGKAALDSFALCSIADALGVSTDQLRDPVARRKSQVSIEPERQ